MTKDISLREFGPLISDNETSKIILDRIKAESPESNVIRIDMDGIVSMATYCAKEIFGQLYVELGPKKFYENIKICNASKDVKLIIRISIRSALEGSSAS